MTLRAYAGPAALTVETVAYAATITPTLPAGNLLLNVGTLTGNLTIANPSGTPADGQQITFRFAQDATGGRVITWGSAYKVASGLPTVASQVWSTTITYWANLGYWYA